jgi:hypothetical protein
MRKRLTAFTFGLVISALLFGGFMHAQNPTPTGGTLVQPSIPQYNCNQHQTATSAGNGAAVVSFAAIPGQTFHICSIYIVEVANAAVTGAAGPAPIETSAGLQSALIWWGDNSSLATGSMKVIADEVYPWTLAALPNTAFSITNSAGQSTQNVRINVTGFYGPF